MHVIGTFFLVLFVLYVLILIYEFIANNFLIIVGFGAVCWILNSIGFWNWVF